MISLIVPAYNSEKTIVKCIESVLRQSYTDIEILIMDGSSSDRTLEILKTYGERLLVHSEKDNGIYDAINKGIKLSKGDWIYILGSDDELYDSDILKRMSVHFKQNNEEVIYGNVMVVGEAGWGHDGHIHDGPFNLKKLLQHNICQQAVFYKRSLFDKIGLFNNNYTVCADWDLVLRAYAKCKIRYVDEIVARFNGGGASKEVMQERFYDEFVPNMFSYFGFKIKQKEFSVISWRIKKYSEVQNMKGKLISSFFYTWIYKKLSKKI